MERLNASDLELLTSKDTFSRFSFNAHERKCLFVNGQGRRFIEAGYPLGLDVDLEGRGMAVADIDQDGRLDVLLRAVARKKLSYFHNEVAGGGHFLRVELAGTRSNRDGIGAVVRVRTGGQQQMRVRTAGSGFQAQSEATLHFGLGNVTQVTSLRVEWPSGAVQEFHNVKGDQIVRVTEGSAVLETRMPPGRKEMSPPRELPTTSAAWAAVDTKGVAWPGAAGGRPLLLSFWASWCEPCRAEVPALNRLYRKLEGRVGVAAVGVAESAESTQAFLAALRPEYPLLPAGQESMKGLLEKMFPEGDIPLPAAILFDGNGIPRRVFRGMVSEDAVTREAEALVKGERR